MSDFSLLDIVIEYCENDEASPGLQALGKFAFEYRIVKKKLDDAFVYIDRMNKRNSNLEKENKALKETVSKIQKEIQVETKVERP